MSNTLAIVSDRKIAVREYKNSTATTDKRLSFKEFGQVFGLENGCAEHRAEFSRYCASRNAEAVAFVEKARSSGLSLSNSVETVDKAGNLVGVRIAFTKATTPKEKAPKLKDDTKGLVESMRKAGCTDAQIDAVLATRKS